MQLSARRQTLDLLDTYSIARSAPAHFRTTCVITLDHQGILAHGEGAPVDQWGETAETMVAAIEADGRSLLGDDLGDLARIADRLRNWDGPQGAKMALDGAVHDWQGKRIGAPVWRLLGLGGTLPPTSFAIGIDTIEGTFSRARAASGYHVLKVKVGGPDEFDLERLEAIRRVSSARLRIDGNECWSLATAESLLPRLTELGVEFIEQPFPASDRDSFLRYRELPGRLPVLVDEGCGDLESLTDIAGYADGVVIKLCKSGGIHQAHRMIDTARGLGLQVMLGCLIESELGISQAAQLAALADHVDLDGHLLIRNRPFAGLGLRDGRLVLSKEPGLGVTPV